MAFPLIFANPWGALALLGLPLVVVIHCLQQKSRTLSISTLFLLERLAPDSKEGHTLTRMRSSPAFWLQILSVLVLAWVLVEPRWLEKQAVQQTVLVLDDSISMRAFSDDLVARTSSSLQQLASLAPHSYWTVLETDPTRPTLYQGGSLSALQEKLRGWSPSLPANDPTHALGLARAIAPRDAVVVFVTDRPRDLPSGVDLLAIGESIENCGLVGFAIRGEGGDSTWRVMAQNYGKTSAHRSWWLEFGGRKTDVQTVDLEPGQARVLEGKFPPGIDQLEVCLQPDRFQVDDRMPIVRPKPKPLTFEMHGNAATTETFERLSQTLPAMTAPKLGVPPDVAFATLGPGSPFPAGDVSSVILYDNPGASNGLKGGPFLSENNPLNQDLNWQGLVMQPGAPLLAGTNREVLLWKDGVPLIYVRHLDVGRRQLVLNFNFTTSNVTRLPAFVLLVSRFVESLRSQKKAPETRNVELAESLQLAADPAGTAVEARGSDGFKASLNPTEQVQVRAPSLPGFFTVTQGGDTLLTGAAQFADARESDFSSAATRNTLAARHASLVELKTRSDAFTPLWLLAIGALLVGYWGVTRPRQS